MTITHYTDDPAYQDYLNDVGANIPDNYDDDVAMEAIVLRYVRDLEGIVADLATVNARHHTAVETLRRRARRAAGFDDA